MTKELQREVLQEKLNKLLSEQVKTYRTNPFEVWKMMEEIAFDNIRRLL